VCDLAVPLLFDLDEQLFARITVFCFSAFSLFKAR